MPNRDDEGLLEEQIGQWRSYLRRRQAIQPVDAEELEDHLREHVASLIAAGLSADEAFLVAVKRLGELDALSREFAREHSERLWKQLVLVSTETAAPGARLPREAVVAFALAVLAAVLLKLPALFGIDVQHHEGFYGRNASLFVLPLLAAFFFWKRRLASGTPCWLAGGCAAAVVFANVYPFARGGATEVLTALHLPIALGLLVGVGDAGSRWSQVAGRMDFVRFAGELLIYYALIAFGGLVLQAFVGMIFKAIGINAQPFIAEWLVPCGAAGAVLVASWLVETKQSVIENMAPVLTRLFTPLFAAAPLTFLGTVLFPGRGASIERHVLIAFDLLLVVVIGLLVYSISARDPAAPPGGFDVLQVGLLG